MNNARIVNAVHIDPYLAQEGGPNCPISHFFRLILIIALPCPSLSQSITILVEFLSNLICQSCWKFVTYMDFSKLIHEFAKVVLCISRPLPNKTKLKFYQDFKACWRCWMSQSTQCLGSGVPSAMLCLMASVMTHPVRKRKMWKKRKNNFYF